MDGYSWLSKCSDEELNRMFDEVLLKSAFSKTPAWKKWMIGIVITIGILQGMESLSKVLNKASTYEIIGMVIGIAAAFGLWNVFSIESQHSKLQNALREELMRREARR